MSSSHSAKGSLDAAPVVQPRAALPRLHRSPVPRHEPREASRVARWESHAQPPTQGTLALALPNVFESLGPGSGYGTEQHTQALARLGVTRHHRLSFAPCAQFVLSL